jgi:hypothetical protein
MREEKEGDEKDGEREEREKIGGGWRDRGRRGS